MKEAVFAVCRQRSSTDLPHNTHKAMNESSPRRLARGRGLPRRTPLQGQHERGGIEHVVRDLPPSFSESPQCEHCTSSPRTVLHAGSGGGRSNQRASSEPVVIIIPRLKTE